MCKDGARGEVVEDVVHLRGLALLPPPRRHGWRADGQSVGDPDLRIYLGFTTGASARRPVASGARSTLQAAVLGDCARRPRWPRAPRARCKLQLSLNGHSTEPAQPYGHSEKHRAWATTTAGRTAPRLASRAHGPSTMTRKAPRAYVHKLPLTYPNWA
jgi:hypothetical protein